MIEEAPAGVTSASGRTALARSPCQRNTKMECFVTKVWPCDESAAPDGFAVAVLLFGMTWELEMQIDD